MCLPVVEYARRSSSSYAGQTQRHTTAEGHHVTQRHLARVNQHPNRAHMKNRRAFYFRVRAHYYEGGHGIQ